MPDLFFQSVNDDLGGVPEDQSGVTHPVVRVPVAVLVPDELPPSPLNKERIGFIEPRVVADSAGEDLQSPRVAGLRPASLAFIIAISAHRDGSVTGRFEAFRF